MPLAILVVDDHSIVRLGLTTLLARSDKFSVIRDAPDLATARRILHEIQFDLLVCDLTLPDGSGIDFCEELRVSHPGLKTLILSMHDENLFAERALKAGAVGYLMKDEADSSLIDAIVKVLAGEIALSAGMQLRLLQRLRGSKNPQQGLASLSDRELGILTLLGNGKSTKEIAFELTLSQRTVEAHRASIKSKLNLRTGADVAAFAISFVRPTTGARQHEKKA